MADGVAKLPAGTDNAYDQNSPLWSSREQVRVAKRRVQQLEREAAVYDRAADVLSRGDDAATVAAMTAIERLQTQQHGNRVAIV